MGSLLSYGKKSIDDIGVLAFRLKFGKQITWDVAISVCVPFLFSMFRIAKCMRTSVAWCKKQQIEVNWICGRTCNLGFYCHKKIAKWFCSELDWTFECTCLIVECISRLVSSWNRFQFVAFYVFFICMNWTVY